MSEVTVRDLDDGDLQAVQTFLAPTEARSMFLVGNSRAQGIRDSGGPLHGAWVGAFREGALCGVIAWFRGPDSIAPACEGHADVLVPALLARLPARPHIIVGTRERVDEVYPRLPPDWRIEKHQREVLLVLRWEDYRPPADHTATPVPLARAQEAADLIDLLHRTWNLPSDAARNLAAAQRLTREARIMGRERDGRFVAMSVDAVSSGRYVHVGSTATEVAHRRAGLARACVAAVIERARVEGRASVGATLFTGEANRDAIALYESMGFTRDADWEMGFLAR